MYGWGLADAEDYLVLAAHKPSNRASTPASRIEGDGVEMFKCMFRRAPNYMLLSGKSSEWSRRTGNCAPILKHHSVETAHSHDTRRPL